MLNSMTGFGKGTAESSLGAVTVEIKSVNSKALDLSIKLPRELNSCEDIIKNAVSKTLSRGKVDVYVQFAAGEKLTPVVSVNMNLAEAYYKAQKEAAEKLNVELRASTQDLFRMPEVFVLSRPEADEDELRKLVEEAAGNALAKITAMRATEGANLEIVLREILDNIIKAFRTIEARAPFVALEYKDKLEERLKKLLDGDTAVDPQRLAQEVAIFADRCNVDEEVARINSHIGQLKTLLEGGKPVGRELDFIVQEFKREINTLGSKSNDTEMFTNVIAVKGELEKFREQIQNIE